MRRIRGIYEEFKGRLEVGAGESLGIGIVMNGTTFVMRSVWNLPRTVYEGVAEPTISSARMQTSINQLYVTTSDTFLLSRV